MKIQFIVAGWHFNYDEFIEGLKELESLNPNINVFWSCHREPTEYIKNNFKYKEFFNGGEECGAYDQALEFLNLEDDTICFFLHDDMIVKDWSFINICLDKIVNQGYKVVGNGRDYSDVLNPFKTTPIGITPEFDGAFYKDYVKPENQYLFDKELPIIKVRPSFICMKYKDVKYMGGFEPRLAAYTPPLTEKDEWVDEDKVHYRGTKGLASYGNLFPALVCYKMNKLFGISKITFLSDTYVDSEYIYECIRGKIDENHTIK